MNGALPYARASRGSNRGQIAAVHHCARAPGAPVGGNFPCEKAVTAGAGGLCGRSILSTECPIAAREVKAACCAAT